METVQVTNGAAPIDEWDRLRRDPLGAGLLPEPWAEDRENLVNMLAAAYSEILEAKQENFGVWVAMMKRLQRRLEGMWKEVGLEAPPWNRDALLARLVPPYPERDPVSHIRLVRAFLTNYGGTCAEHIRYRMEHEGNVHVEFTGFTGSAKSSAAIRLMDWIKPIRRGRLGEHLSADLSELPKKLMTKQRGESVTQDEFPKLAGEGAVTIRAMFDNIEDTIRASGVNLFAISPRRQDHATMQCRLEAVLANWDKKFTVFLVSVEETALGLWAIPWAPDDLWAPEYKPWKFDMVKRALAGQFKDNAYLVKMAMRVFENERFVQYFESATNKPKKGDFSAAVELFAPQMMTHAQVDKVVSLMFMLATNYERLAPRCSEWFGVEPNEGLKRVAAKTKM